MICDTECKILTYMCEGLTFLSWTLMYIKIKMCCCTLHVYFVHKFCIWSLSFPWCTVNQSQRSKWINFICLFVEMIFYKIWAYWNHKLFAVKEVIEYLLEGVILRTFWKSLMETYIRHMAIYPNTGAYIGFD